MEERLLIVLDLAPCRVFINLAAGRKAAAVFHARIFYSKACWLWAVEAVEGTALR
jgi:hypothetical protein